ncbi:hypothetical protein GCM10010174_70550 [Kutzneria viridogrisea]|uniref:Lipocalin-like domain-containing protein n=1 Tax=Kutzneria viridogrisea TaxID=47990 RepID=A0ABR6BAP3_9PSEU|nr:hypothetical protein [Kutzneria viridogrisea]
MTTNLARRGVLAAMVAGAVSTVGAATAFAATKPTLVSTWDLAVYQVLGPNGEVTYESRAPQSRGRLTYTAEHAMSAVLELAAPGGTRKVVAYAGTWTLAGDVVSHSVLTSLEASWVGTIHRRQVLLQGDVLSLTVLDPAPGQAPSRLIWHRAAPNH